MRRDFLWPLGAALTAFLVRTVIFLSVHSDFPCLFTNLRGMDPYVYETWGAEIARGALFTSSFNGSAYTPIYAYIVGFLFWVFDPDPQVVTFVQFLIGSFMVFPLWVLLRRSVSRGAALTVLAIYVLFALAPFHELFVLRDQWLGWLVLLAWTFHIRLRERRTLVDALGLGALCGILFLFRPNTILFLPFFLTLEILSPEPRVKNLRRCAAMASGAVAVGIPFALVQALSTAGQFALREGGFRLLVRGNIHTAKFGGSWLPPGLDEAASAVSGSLSAFFRWYVAEWVHYPLEMLTLYGRKIWMAFATPELSDAINFELTRPLVSGFRWTPLTFGFISALAILGSVVVIRKRRDQLPLLLFTALNVLSLVLVIVQGRYRPQYLFLFLLLGALAIDTFLSWIREKKWALASLSAVTFAGIVAALGVSVSPVIRHVDYFNFGRQCMLSREWSRAVSLFSQAVSAEPSERRYSYFRALSELSQAQEVRLRTATVPLERAKARESLAALFLVTKDLNQARAEARASLSESPTADAFFTLAVLEFVEKDHDSMNRALDQALALEPSHARAKNMRAQGRPPAQLTELWPDLFLTKSAP